MGEKSLERPWASVIMHCMWTKRMSWELHGISLGHLRALEPLDRDTESLSDVGNSNDRLVTHWSVSVQIRDSDQAIAILVSSKLTHFEVIEICWLFKRRVSYLWALVARLFASPDDCSLQILIMSPLKIVCWLLLLYLSIFCCHHFIFPIPLNPFPPITNSWTSSFGIPHW